MLVKIFSFNLLSQALARKNTYPKASNEALDIQHRISLIMNILIEKTEGEYIICLQEVSLEYKKAFTQFFLNRDYTFICENYSNSYNDFMGVAIAYPITWELLQYEIITPCTMAWKNLPEYRYTQNNITSYDYFLSWFTTWHEWFSGIKRESIATQICKIYNRFPLVKLSREGTIINVCSVHMPCKFNNRELMSAYYYLVLLGVSSINDNIIIAGDFNTVREADLYALVTTGDSIYEKIPNLKLSLKDCFSDEGVYTYNSYTCINKVENEFKDIIDYIFVDKKIEVIEKAVYPQDNKLLPNEDHPSDHCYLSVTLDV